MNPIPACAMQWVIASGPRSMRTPSAVSTSAAPQREESARLPCLATGTPAPATMKAAQVEMLNEPDASPPVATTWMGWSFDGEHLRAHGANRAGDLVHGFAAHPQRHQQSAHLRGRGFARHHAVEGGCRLVARQCRAGGDFSDDRFEILHQLLSGRANAKCTSCWRGGAAAPSRTMRAHTVRDAAKKKPLLRARKIRACS